MMLTKAVQRSSGSLQDATKQLLLWALNKKRDFSYYKNSSFYSAEDDDAFGQRKFDDEFTPRRQNRNWSDRKWDSQNWNRSYRSKPRGNNDFNDNRSFNSKWDFDIPKKTKKFTFDQELKPFNKCFYQPHPNVLNRSAEEITKFHNEHSIKLFGAKRNECPPPIFSFEELNLPENILNKLRALNYTEPTPVQSMTWPIALSGYNMVGISRTGSGKTLGFVLPALTHIKHQLPLENGEGPIALIIAPTRELGQQILKVIQPFARSYSIRSVGFLGGTSKQLQLRDFGLGAEICVATPGRFLDMMKSEVLNLSRCTYCVLDEADRLLDMGFYPQIEDILHYSREDKQISMWSATWPKEVVNLAETFLGEYIAVKFGSIELAANPKITQIIRICDEREKSRLLLEILDEIGKQENCKTLIFASTKFQVDRIGLMLTSKRYKALTIHGGKTQQFRDRSLSRFRSGNIDILVGTLVVGRGLDVTDIGHVINFDFPNDLEDYVHVIGRTARGENSGTAYSFFTYNDAPRAKKLIKILQASNQEVDPELMKLARMW